MVKIGFKIILTIGIAFLGVILASKLNVFSYITFIPEAHSFDICLGIYITVLDLIFECLINYIGNIRSKLFITFYSPNTEPLITSKPVLYFNSQDTADIKIKISVNGLKKHFKDTTVVIPKIMFATMQPSRNYNEMYINSDGDCIIEIYKLFGNTNQKVNMSFDYRLKFIKEPIDNNNYDHTNDPSNNDGRETDIKPEIKSHVIVKSTNNYFKIHN